MCAYVRRCARRARSSVRVRVCSVRRCGRQANAQRACVVWCGARVRARAACVVRVACGVVCAVRLRVRQKRLYAACAARGVYARACARARAWRACVRASIIPPDPEPDKPIPTRLVWLGADKAVPQLICCPFLGAFCSGKNFWVNGSQNAGNGLQSRKILPALKRPGMTFSPAGYFKIRYTALLAFRGVKEGSSFAGSGWQAAEMFARATLPTQFYARAGACSRRRCAACTCSRWFQVSCLRRLEDPKGKGDSIIICIQIFQNNKNAVLSTKAFLLKCAHIRGLSHDFIDHKAFILETEMRKYFYASAT